MRYSKVFIQFALLLGLASNSNATIVIDVGDHVLLQGTPNQQISVLISSAPGDSDISGSNIRAEIGDGDNVLSEPVFQGAGGTLEGVSITGTVFDVPGGFLSGSGPAASNARQYVNAGTTTPTNETPNGVFINFLIDTTTAGAPGDVFPLRLASIVAAGLPDTELLGPIGNANPLSGVVINNGSITIAAVPEPSAALFMGIAAVTAVVIPYLRRRRS